MQLLYTILIMLLVVSGTRISAQFIPLPLPILQIVIGALLAVPALGLHVRLDPELFLLLFIPPLLFVDDCTSVYVLKWTLRISYKSMA